ncbi:putative structural maintenance of chromosomes protein [Gregarina niphandrodes]|uniref:Structural maintenance of chromosomes protein n=1 Tax=Gregarina niphandrodes TaxID=110365 RepID=A0A023B895_GRENI|nr:putative structural maintenance of chromosomes protein [Gregarina niphandrodes]EZG68219.1 putative structural maintenance of chromosomes protein [Gregarina niphandrodes]|eukprot:XP_011130021.1 putative structural maintenance of chromosomes protein [Gregarina niphandrodes]
MTPQSADDGKVHDENMEEDDKNMEEGRALKSTLSVDGEPFQADAIADSKRDRLRSSLAGVEVSSNGIETNSNRNQSLKPVSEEAVLRPANRSDDAWIEGEGDLVVVHEAGCSLQLASPQGRGEVRLVAPECGVEGGTDTVAPVLILDWLELTNFKSYWGLVRVGPFHNRLSAIIGPNGSGKSNMIDALLFVFGRRAIQLRQKKLTQLIHSSANHKADFARVSVIFARSYKSNNQQANNQQANNQQADNQQANNQGSSYQGIDGHEFKREYAFTLSREIHVSGTSRYVIEDRTVSHQEMVEFVKAQGIDLNHNRFLILQGEVEQLSMLPPKAPASSGDSGSQASQSSRGRGGLLEILENLFGSEALIPKIQNREQDYDTLRQALDESSGLVSRCEVELKALAGPCRQAFGYVRLHKKLIVAKARLEAKERYKLVTDAMTKEAEICDLKNEENICVQSLDQLDKELEELRQSTDQMIAEEVNHNEGESDVESDVENNVVQGDMRGELSYADNQNTGDCLYENTGDCLDDRLKRKILMKKLSGVEGRTMKSGIHLTYDLVHDNMVKKFQELKSTKDHYRMEEDRIQSTIMLDERKFREVSTEREALLKEIDMKIEEGKNIIEKCEDAKNNLPKQEKQLEFINEKLIVMDDELKEDLQVINDEIQVITNEKNGVCRKFKLINNIVIEKESILELENEKKLAKDKEKERQIELLKSLKQNIKTHKNDLTNKVGLIEHIHKDRILLQTRVQELKQILVDGRQKKNELEIRKSELEKRHNSKSVNRQAAILYQKLNEQFLMENSVLYKLGTWLLDYVECDYEQYGSALTSAGLGEDIVLTRTDDASEAIIKFVKQNQLGRVTCVTINRAADKWRRLMEEWYKSKDRRYGSLQNIIPVMDLIKIKSFEMEDSEQNIKPIIWSRVRDTLLCTININEARKIAFGKNERFKVVTAKGEVIEKNGSMTGGCGINFIKQAHIYHSGLSVGGEERSRTDEERELKNVKEDLLNIDRVIRDSVEEDNRLAQKINQMNMDINCHINEGKDLEHLILNLTDTYQKAVSETRQPFIEIEQPAAQDTDGIDTVNENELLKKLMELAPTDNSFAEMEITLRSVRLTKLIGIRDKIRQHIKDRDKKLSICSEQIKSLGGVERKRLLDERSSLEKAINRDTDLISNGVEKINTANNRVKQLKESIIPSLEAKKESLIKGTNHNKAICEDLILKQKLHQTALDKFSKRLENFEKKIHEVRQQRQGVEDRIRLYKNKQNAIKDATNEIQYKVNQLQKLVANKDKLLEQLLNDFNDLPSIQDLGGDDTVDDGEHDGHPHSIDSNRHPDAEELKGVIDREQTIGDGQEAIVLKNGDGGMAIEKTPDKADDADNTIIEFPDTKNLDLYKTQATKNYQLEVFKWEEEVKNLGSSMMDISIITEYQKKSHECLAFKSARDRRRDDLEKAYKELQSLKQERRQIFDTGFLFLSEKVKELYQMLTRGGDAELEYKDCNSPFTEGIEYSVRPPRKSWRSIHNLSGGEKTLSSLALIFALHHYRPTPIYFLDEIDAALDTQNVLLIASYVASCQANNAQFVVISLRHEFFQRADRLVGVCKVEDKTKICVIDPDRFASLPVRKKRSKPDEDSPRNQLTDLT